MFRVWRQSGVHKWFVRLLVIALLIPSTPLFALPGQHAEVADSPPCHQSQQQSQFAEEVSNQNDCCDSLHQCAGNCEHDCSDCYSSSSIWGVITLPAEPQLSGNSHSIPVSSYHTGLAPTLLLRPPCQPV